MSAPTRNARRYLGRLAAGLERALTSPRSFRRAIVQSLKKVGPGAARDTFCVLAFNHLQVAPNGTVKMCCIAGEDISDEGRTMSLYSDNYDAIWNSKYMRDARRGMAQGEQISPCMRCYREEESVGQSRRTVQNEIWLKETGKTPAQFLENARAQDWRVATRPGFLQLNMGNLCNLACRMCSSQYSSRIESDPVHNKWMPAAWPDVARWHGKTLHFGPRPFFGVTYEGFYGFEMGNGDALRWSSGEGSLRFEIPAGAKLTGLGLSLRAPRADTPVEIRVNGLPVFSGAIGPAWSQSFDLPGLSNQSALVLEISAPPTAVGRRKVGIALTDAWVERSGVGVQKLGNERALTRLASNAGWWADEAVMFGEILGDPQALRYIIFQGGEPFLVKEFEQILDRLIETGVAADITFEVVSNLTMISDSLIEKLAKLKQLIIYVSADGIGPVIEYIRYPANWRVIEENIQRLKALPNTVLMFSTAVQLYNLQDMTNILSYCDANAIDLHTHFLVGPEHLNVALLPRAVRLKVIKALSAYLSSPDTRPANRVSCEYMIKFLEEHIDIQYRDKFQTFVKFTNDLDLSRGQSFRTTYRNLVEEFANDGLFWTDETAFAGPAPSVAKLAI